MADDRISMPSSQGGLVRYYNEYKSKVQVKPIHVVIVIIAVIIINIVLRLMAA